MYAKFHQDVIIFRGVIAIWLPKFSADRLSVLNHN